MKCPNDNTNLVISERQNIEIDYCPDCRGVWLDRGELDKIIDRSTVVASPQSEKQSYDSRRSSDYSSHQQPYRKKRKESFLGDLFDF